MGFIRCLFIMIMIMIIDIAMAPIRNGNGDHQVSIDFDCKHDLIYHASLVHNHYHYLLIQYSNRISQTHIICVCDILFEY